MQERRKPCYFKDRNHLFIKYIHNGKQEVLSCVANKRHLAGYQALVAMLTGVS